VTKAVEITLDMQQVDDALVIVGSLEIALADYDIAQPSAIRPLGQRDRHAGTAGVLQLGRLTTMRSQRISR
jgi:hypothetical protein